MANEQVEKTIRLEFYFRCPSCNYIDYGKETETRARDYLRFCPNCNMPMMSELRKLQKEIGER